MKRALSENARIGFYICHCGTNIAGMVDVDAVAKYVGTLPNVALSRHYKYMCSDPGQELVKRDIHRNYAHLRSLRNRLCGGIRQQIPDIRINCDLDQSVPNTLSVCIRGIDSNVLLAGIQDRVAASTGSACHSHETKVSSVLRAMNVPVEWARGSASQPPRPTSAKPSRTRPFTQGSVRVSDATGPVSVPAGPSLAITSGDRTPDSGACNPVVSCS